MPLTHSLSFSFSSVLPLLVTVLFRLILFLTSLCLSLAHPTRHDAEERISLSNDSLSLQLASSFAPISNILSFRFIKFYLRFFIISFFY